MATPAPIGKMIEKSERGELSSSELKELIEVIRLRRQVKVMHENYEAPYPQGEDKGGGGGFAAVQTGSPARRTSARRGICSRRSGS